MEERVPIVADDPDILQFVRMNLEPEGFRVTTATGGAQARLFAGCGIVAGSDPAAELVETLQGKGPFTVFAPTDDAFAKLPAGTVESLLKPENKEKLVGMDDWVAAQLDFAETRAKWQTYFQ